MPFTKGQSGNPKGRPKRTEAYAESIGAAEKVLGSKLTPVARKQIELAIGGFEIGQEEWQPAGLVMVDDWEYDAASGKSYKVKKKAYPDTPDDELVLVKVTKSVAAPDRSAGQYILNQFLGKPPESVDITNSDGSLAPEAPTIEQVHAYALAYAATIRARTLAADTSRILPAVADDLPEPLDG